jgi:hypothetical protein
MQILVEYCRHQGHACGALPQHIKAPALAAAPLPCSLGPPSTLLQVAALQRQLSDANASAVEIRAASHALIDLVGDASALAAMLHCYSHKVGRSQALLLKQHAAGERQPGLPEWHRQAAASVQPDSTDAACA